MSQEPEEVYANIRELLGHFIGQRVLDITQHDQDEFEETGQSYVMLMFENGDWIKIPVGDKGFWHSSDKDDDEPEDDEDETAI